MDAPTLLGEIDAAKKRYGIRDSTIGLGALNDGHFVKRLRQGKRCWPETAQKVMDFIAKLNAFQTLRTEDGTVIAYDPATGTVASGKTRDDAVAELRRLLAGREAA